MASKLQVGVAETTINPRRDMQIDGNIGVRRPAQMVLDDIHARAVVFESGETRFLLLSMELLAITTEWSEAIRDFAADELGFDRDAVMVHVVQDHSAPSMGQIMLSDRLEAAKTYPWIRGSDPEYGPMALERLKPMIRRAAENTRPAQLLAATALESRAAFNRRVAMRDGTSEMGFRGRPEDALYREGASDPEVGVAIFATEELETVAALLHHTCHPVHWTPHTAIHGDWPGAWAAQVRRELLPGATPLVLNGCCGNVHHHDAFNSGREDTPQSMARLLTDAARRALCGPVICDDAPLLACKTLRFDIPFRDFPPEVFEAAHKLIEENPEPIWMNEEHTRYEWDWHFAASLLDLEERLANQDAFEYEIQAVRLGDLALVALPGEPFVEVQLDIKQRSPAKRTFVAHMCNRYVGYIPTPEAIGRGGYETRPSGGSKLAPEALRTIADTSVEMLEALYG